MIAFALALFAQAATPSPAPVHAPLGAKEIWGKRCVFCHGVDGKSQTKKGRQYKAPNFTTPKWQRSTDDSEIVDAVTNGVPKTKMPPFKDKLSPEEIKSLVPYVRAFGAK